jgi:hypothetical protein
MERREECAARERLAHVLGLRVTDTSGMAVGVAVGRIITGTSVDLLVRRRRLFHRATYLRLPGAAIITAEHTLVYHPAAEQRRVNLAVVPTSSDGDPATGDAA